MRKWLLIAVSLSSGAALWQLPPSAAAADSGTRFKVSRKFLYPTEFTAGKAYSPGVLVGDTLYIAGQIDKDPTGAQPVGMAAQTRLAMTNLGSVLGAAGMDPAVRGPANRHCLGNNASRNDV